MSLEEKGVVQNVAFVFLSKPMTICELSRRVNISESKLRHYLSYELKKIDYSTYLSVKKILNYLDGANSVAC